MSSSSDRPPKLRGKQRLLLRVERFSRERYRLVFLLAILAVAGASWLGARLKLESDMLRLIPQGHEKVDAFKAALRDFGSIDYLLVLLDGGAEADPDRLEDFADVLAERLRAQSELIETVDYKLELDERFLELLYRNQLLFLNLDQLPELRQKLTDRAIREQVRDIQLRMKSPTSVFIGDVVRNDPLNLMPLFLGRVVGSRGGLKVDLSDGYYLSADRRSLIMLVKPTGASQNIDFDRELMRRVERLVEETRGELLDESDEAAHGIEVRYTGNYALAPQENALILKDAARNLTISLVLVSALYWLCYRRFAALLYSSVPLLVGQALTFGLAYFTLRQLNAASSSFTALLMGLGTDFTIVMYARYVEERRAGNSLARATELMVGETGLGVFTGAITSAGTFYAMCVSRFRGLTDLGFLIGSGILLCGVAIVFLMPAMIRWNEGVRRRRSDVVKKLHLQSFGLEHLIPLSARYRKTAILLVTLLTVAGGVLTWTRWEFNDSINALRSDSSEAIQVQREVIDRFGSSLTYMMAIAQGKNLEEAVERTEQIAERLEPFLENGTLGGADSILTYLPRTSEQQQIVEAVRAEADAAFDKQRIKGTFLAALDEYGFRREPFEDYLDRMDSFLAPERPLTLTELRNQGLDRLIDRYVKQTPDEVRIVTYMFPTDPRWKRRPPPGLEQAVSAGDPMIVVTGTNVAGQALRQIFGQDIVLSVSVGLLLVFVLLLVDFRSLRLTAVAMVQLVTGVTMMLGLMTLLREIGFPGSWEVNYVNAFVVTMILGVGIDYSIHLVHRLHLTGGKIEAGLLETGKAVVMASLTNMAGFGTLVLGHYPALQSFGGVALLGSITCLLTSLTLVPALMADEPPKSC